MASLYGMKKQSKIMPAAGPPKPLNDWLQNAPSKIAEHVPSEIIAAYAIGLAYITDSMGDNSAGIWAVICWVLAIVFRATGTKGEGAILNAIMTSVAFPLYVITLGGAIYTFTFDPRWAALTAFGLVLLASRFHNNE